MTCEWITLRIINWERRTGYLFSAGLSEVNIIQLTAKRKISRVGLNEGGMKFNLLQETENIVLKGGRWKRHHAYRHVRLAWWTILSQLVWYYLFVVSDIRLSSRSSIDTPDRRAVFYSSFRDLYWVCDCLSWKQCFLHTKLRWINMSDHVNHFNRDPKFIFIKQWT